MTGKQKSPGALEGAWAGAFLTAILIALFFLGWQGAGLPFAPFDAFDWMARVLPGRLITTSIDAMVAVIRVLGIGEISQTAKSAEQAMAVVALFIGGIVLAVVFFSALARWRRGPPASVALGVLLGGVVGLVLLLISLGVNRTATTGPVASSLWILAVSLGWGLALGWVRQRLAELAGPSSPALQASADPLDRRRFIVRLGEAAAVITVTGGGVGAWLGSTRRQSPSPDVQAIPWSATHPLPNAGAPVQPVKGTRPEFTPVKDHYRIDINTRPPIVREGEWRLRIGGLVDRPMDWSLQDLRNRYTPLTQFITLACISNPIGGSLIGTQRWTGVPLRQLLEEVGPGETATHLRIHSVDDFFEIVPLEDALADERIMLTYAWDGLPLPSEHGFPLRIYIPDRYGMKQPKWIESMELIDHDEEGYWVRRGWDKEARMKATSVIDTVAVDMMIAGADDTTIVPVGGIAHAGDRGISRVQVQVDDGPWADAELREPLSDKTWVLWRFGWPFQAGDHRLTVRCFEGDGTPQIATRSPVSPSGATGLDHEEVML